MSRILLLRHGKASDHWGDYDQLSERGFFQAGKLGERFVAERIELVAAYHGTLRRQRETAETVRDASLAAGLPFPTLVEEPGLDEIAPAVVDTALAQLTDLALREQVQAWVSGAAKSTRETRAFLFGTFARYAAGELAGEFEPWPAFHARVKATLAKITDPGRGAVAAFTSGGVVAAAAGVAVGTPIDRTMRLMASLENASLTELRWSRSQDAFALVRFNDVGHLPLDARTLL